MHLIMKGFVMKKMLFTMTVLAIAAGAFASDMGVTVDTSFATKHLWHGMDMYDDVAALSAAVNIDLGEDGFYAGAKYTMPGSGGNAYNSYSQNDMTQWDYWVGFKNQAMVGEALQLDYDLSYTYYDWGTIRRNGVKLASGADLDVQELALNMTLPNVCPFGMFVPRYQVAYMFEPYGSERNMFGFYHMVGLGYNFAVADMPMFASVDAVYDDGAITDEHDWTRMVAGLATEIDMGDSGKLVPGIYYQKPFKDHVTGPVMDDDFYATLTYSLSF